ncbi:hypothetical protein [Nostoc sp. CMAA1605]|uniref:hypothetical protein n=1 Tax=Nostoc sp. CMAA1605 TaxID=2055159 RepID=UPI001F2C341E|nr:hypothetical protein [Nostoc sp. CMAA1605]MCF4968538.1 hypothetical protein [Nostoc sp. CMAA1605]
MKTAEKLAAGWLITLGFTFLISSVSAVVERNSMFKPISPGENEELVREYFNRERASLLNATATQGLIFGLPTVILGSWLAWGLYQESRNERKVLQQQVSDRLQSTFYNMIQQNDGRITVLGFAMQSQLPATTARKFLDEKAQEFNANFKVSEEGSVSYYFDL